MSDDMFYDSVDIDNEEYEYVEEETFEKKYWFFFDLLDKNKEMMIDSNPTCFNFLYRVSGCEFSGDDLITYSTVVDNSKLYSHLFCYGIDSLTDREKEVLTLRFGIKDGKGRTSEEVEKEYNVTRARIVQIEAKALRKMNHPRWTSKRKLILWNNQPHGVLKEKTHSDHIETIIKEEISSYMQGDSINVDDLFSGAIIKSPRFREVSPSKQYFADKNIREIDMSVRTCNVLNRAGINKLSELMELDNEQMKKIRNLGAKSREEVRFIQAQYSLNPHLNATEETINSFKVPILVTMCLKRLGINTYSDLACMSLSKLVQVAKECNCSADILFETIGKWEEKLIKSYSLNSNFFETPGEIPITQTVLPVSDMVKLIQKGLFYVSDVFEYYSLITGNKTYTADDIEIVVKLLRVYSSPVVRISVSERLLVNMIDKDVSTMEQIEKRRESFGDEFKEEIELILSKYSNAYKKVNENAVQ